MTAEKEILMLLEYVTDAERDLFNRMYPCAVSAITDKSWALSQVKRTLHNRKQRIQQLKDENAALHAELNNVKNQLSACRVSEKQLEQEIVDLKYVPEKAVGDDLLFLRALDAAGVDNWEGYDHAQEIYEEYKQNAII